MHYVALKHIAVENMRAPFIKCSAFILIITAIAKLQVLFHGSVPFHQTDSVFTFLTMRELLLVVAAAEIFSSVWLLCNKNETQSVWFIFSLGVAFGIYRTGQLFLEGNASCPCLGGLEAWFPSNLQPYIEAALRIFVVFFVAGGLLFGVKMFISNLGGHASVNGRRSSLTLRRLPFIIIIYAIGHNLPAQDAGGNLRKIVQLFALPVSPAEVVFERENPPLTLNNVSYPATKQLYYGCWNENGFVIRLLTATEITDEITDAVRHLRHDTNAHFTAGRHGADAWVLTGKTLTRVHAQQGDNMAAFYSSDLGPDARQLDAIYVNELLLNLVRNLGIRDLDRSTVQESPHGFSARLYDGTPIKCTISVSQEQQDVPSRIEVQLLNTNRSFQINYMYKSLTGLKREPLYPTEICVSEARLAGKGVAEECIKIHHWGHVPSSLSSQLTGFQGFTNDIGTNLVKIFATNGSLFRMTQSNALEPVAGYRDETSSQSTIIAMLSIIPLALFLLVQLLRPAFTALRSKTSRIEG